MLLFDLSVCCIFHDDRTEVFSFVFGLLQSRHEDSILKIDPFTKFVFIVYVV